MHGIIVVYKERGYTSFDVCAILRRKLGIRKIGHLGTLDPQAEGVLPVTVGRAGRIAEYLEPDLKTYRVTARLGVETDTQDIWGKVCAQKDASGVTEADLRHLLPAFTGLIRQKPPLYSAVKVNGKKLYEYARAGKDVEVKERELYVPSLHLLSFEASDMPEFTLEITCTHGGYIRTICHDMGKRLGCGAAMTSLLRLQAGTFSLRDARKLGEIKSLSTEEIEKILIPADQAVSGLGKASCKAFFARLFASGVELHRDQWQEILPPPYRDRDFYLPLPERFKRLYLVYAGEIFLGIGLMGEDGSLHAEKVFATDSNT